MMLYLFNFTTSIITRTNNLKTDMGDNPESHRSTARLTTGKKLLSDPPCASAVDFWRFFFAGNKSVSEPQPLLGPLGRIPPIHLNVTRHRPVDVDSEKSRPEGQIFYCRLNRRVYNSLQSTCTSSRLSRLNGTRGLTVIRVRHQQSMVRSRRIQDRSGLKMAGKGAFQVHWC